MPLPELRKSLLEGAASVGVMLDARQADQLLHYLDLLSRWNRVHNLTAVNSPAQAVRVHLLDCLAVVQPLRRQVHAATFRLLDVGSGAGLPGIVLSVAMPGVDVTCLEAAGKKASFIRQAGIELDLKGFHVLHERAEATGQGGFRIITSRAFSSLRRLVSATRHRLDPLGMWMALKGEVPVSEIEDAQNVADVFHVEHVEVPGLSARRCLVWMRPA